MLNRAMDVSLSALSLVLLSPVIVIAAAAVFLEDGGPIVFRQTRVGLNGRLFEILKLRSMRNRAGRQITAASDPRITQVGRFLRRYKLDEIPQLWNVIRGDMAIVGPRPEVPQYVSLNDRIWREVLSRRPGLTDVATLVYRNEQEVLAAVDEPERHYREVILPSKLALNEAYLRTRSSWTDFKVIIMTVRYSLIPGNFDARVIRDQFALRDEL